jgi:Mannosyltransferase (PIG-V)
VQHSLSDKEINKVPTMQDAVEPAGTMVLPQTLSGGWREALRQVLPLYLGLHVAFLLLTYFATLFSINNFSSHSLSFMTLLNAWNHWDSGIYTGIAINGYNSFSRMAFFPLFPLAEHGLALLVRDPFVAGLIISNIAMFGVFIVLYRLVVEDFDAERAWRTVLYLAFFPTAFFFAAAYNESLFLFFALLTFYYLRRGRWWLAALTAFFAGLTRSVAVCLCVPFAWEYMRQHAFQWRKFRLDVLSGIGIIGGVILFAFYGYLRFHDPLAFSHAQKTWGRQLSWPWHAFAQAFKIIWQQPVLSFQSIHVVMDLLLTLVVLVALLLAFMGPWKLARDQWSYAFYAVSCYLVVMIVPETGGYPLASMGRYMLENFPAFIILAAMGKNRAFNIYYISISLPLLAFWLLQWLTGRWIV